MKRMLTTAATLALLLGLGVLAMLARPSDTVTALVPTSSQTLAAAAARPDQAAPNAPDAPAATLGWNAIGLPLDMSATVGTADQLKAYIESFCNPACAGSVEKISKWDPAQQLWITRGAGAIPPNFTIYPGQALLVAIKAGAVITFTSIVGNVPPQCPATGCIQYGVSTGLPALAQTGWTFIMIPLDKTGPTTADALKADIGPGLVTKVSKWDATQQLWITRGTGAIPPNYNVSPGYPYLIYAAGLTNTTWPTTWP